MRTNIMAPLALAESFVEHVAASERKLIVMMTSQMGSTAGAPGGSYIYRTSKAALNNIARNLSSDLQSRDITVIAIDPGWVKTEMGGPNAQIARRGLGGQHAQDLCQGRQAPDRPIPPLRRRDASVVIHRG